MILPMLRHDAPRSVDKVEQVEWFAPPARLRSCVPHSALLLAFPVSQISHQVSLVSRRALFSNQFTNQLANLSMDTFPRDEIKEPRAAPPSADPLNRIKAVGL